MVTKNTNPFVLPGFGQDGDMATNPVLASMEMMRKAWEGLATAGGFDASRMVPGSSPDDIERRISDLRAVENWLRMNLSMLSSTIQALEVQRSTMATLQAFVASAGGGKTDASAPSPLDVALGIRRGADVAPSANTSGLFGTAAQPSGPAPTGTAHTQSASDHGSQADQAGSSASGADATPATTDATGAVMKSWWDMLQSQFDNLASATAAGIQSAEAMQEAAVQAQKKAVESTRATAQAMQESAAAPVKTAKKAAAKKTAAKTTAARKAAAKKSPAKKAATKKTAAKTASASKKSSSATRGVARKS